MNVLRATWHDLVRRRLLPVAVILLGALVAVPVLLAKEPEPVPAPTPAAPGRGVTTALAQPVVALDEQEPPPARRRVLGDRKDPFRPAPLPEARKARSRTPVAGTGTTGSPATGSGRSGAGAGGVTADAGTGVGVPVFPVVTPPTAAPTPSGDDERPADEPDDGEDQPATPDDVITIRFGDAAADVLETRTLERLAPLPDAEAPFAAYLGLDEDGAAVFLLDAGVTAEGDGTCRPDPRSCATFTLREDETEFLHVPGEDGAEGVVYELDVVDIPRGAKGTAAKASARAASEETAAAEDAAPGQASPAEVAASGQASPAEVAASSQAGPAEVAPSAVAPTAADATPATPGQVAPTTASPAAAAPVRDARAARALVRERTAALRLRYAFDRRTRTVSLERPRSWRDALRRVLRLSL